MPQITNTVLKDILSVARFSPSSHNTQPWKVQISADTLFIGYVPSRQLKVGDPKKRELFISLGCFIESVVRTAEDLGYAVDCTINNEGSNKVATLSFSSKKNTAQTEWTSLIKNRHSDRRHYETKAIPAKLLSSFESIKYGKSTMMMVDDPEVITLLAKKTREATFAIMSDPLFREELASWVRNNWTKKPDGMPAYTQGMPGPVSLAAKLFIKKVAKVADDQAKKDSQRIAHSAALGLVCVKDNSAESWINAGRIYQAACLEALKNNIKTAAVSAAIILPATTKDIKQTLKLAETPVALLRFGYAKKSVKPTPRRTTEDIIS